MRQVEAREFEGLGKVTVQQLPGRAAGKLLVRLSAHLFPALGQGGEALSKLDLSKGTASEVDVGGVIRGLSAAAKVLFEKLTPDEFDAVLALLLENARVTKGGKDAPLWVNWDDLMAGQMFTGLKVFMFALEVNYRDFLPALGALSDTAQGALQSKASTTSSPSGPAGA